MALALLGILTACPLMACGLLSTSPPCCHHTPKNTVQVCPYLLLEKGKTSAAMAHPLSATLDPVSHDFSVSVASSFIGSESRIPNSHGLYLRIRVLLI